MRVEGRGGRAGLPSVETCVVAAALVIGQGCGTVVLDVPEDEGLTDSGGTDGGGQGSGPADDPEEDPGGSGGDSDGEPESLGCDDYEQVATGMLEASCSGCHGPAGDGPGGFADATDVAAMIADGRIVPGDAGGSPVWVRADGGTMPPAGTDPQPSAAQIEALGAWIDDCLPQAQCSHDEFNSLEQMLVAMRDDIRQQDAEDRPFVRYLTITHVYNTGLCGDALDLHRWGMSKAVNSLSFEVDVRAPAAIDAQETIYRIDLRDYGWSTALWESIVDQSPYAVAYDLDEARDLSADAQTAVPFLISDAFVVDAVQPPLYHEILDLPSTRSQLEADLGVDVEADILAEEVQRAGFADSGVSVNNRVIERHVLPSSGTRTYWLSYDFASNAQQSNIFSNPLAFQEAGNEMIFSLPNGLHGYMIVDGDGGRLDEAPDDIVTDPAQPNGNVVNGLSCMNCHLRGIIEHADALREHVLNPANGFSQGVRDAVEALHPENPDLMVVKSIDRDNYADAVGLLGIPTDFPSDPVNAVFRDFDGDVDLERAASELGVPTEVLTARLGGLSEDLQPLATGVVKRETFTINYAQAVCDLALGVTDACGSLGGPGDCQFVPPECFEEACQDDPIACPFCGECI